MTNGAAAFKPPPEPTPLVSASQVTLFRECARKWAWKYLARIDTPQSDASALGDSVDEGQLQPYLRDGRPFDFTKPDDSGYIAASGLQFLPKPATDPDGPKGLAVQKHFLLPSASSQPGKPAPFGYQGYLDLWLPNGGAPELDAKQVARLPVAPGVIVPVVGDFKTTKDFRWAKGENALSVDVQAMLYATWAMYATGARVIDLTWIYFRTKGARKAQRTHLRVSGAHVIEQFRAIDRTANEMFVARRNAPACVPDDPVNAASIAQHITDTFEPNVDMCESYGGCPYRANCNLSPAQIIDAQIAKAKQANGLITKEAMMTTTTTAGVFDRLRAKKAGAGEGATAIVITPPAAPAPPQEVMGMSDRAVPAPPAGATVPASLATTLPPGALPINPPESALPPAPPVGSVQSAAPSISSGQPAQVDTSPAPAEAAPRRRRTLKAAPDAGAAPAPALTTSTPPPATAAANPAAPPTTGKKIGTLYLDCYPIGPDTTPAEAVYQAAQQRILEQHKVPDYRLIDFKGAGIFACTLGDILDNAASWGDIVLDTRTPEGAIAKSIFVFRAERIVQGCR